MKKWETPTGRGHGLLFVMLLMPLHGAVIAQHHLPQSLTEIRQAGNVAVKGDMLPTETGMKGKEVKVKHGLFSKMKRAIMCHLTAMHTTLSYNSVCELKVNTKR